MAHRKLIVFVKAPRPGTVKTRLAEAIGSADACKAYRVLVETLLEQLAELPEVELRFSPADAAREIQPWLRAGWEARPQGTGDLGQRLVSAFAEAFSAGVKRVVIIGSDCPAVAVADIECAWSALLSHDVALGPARDGGYWLIGLRQPQPEFFHSIPWSTADVLRETQQRARLLKLKTYLLRELTDVDTVNDWHEFMTVHIGRRGINGGGTRTILT